MMGKNEIQNICRSPYICFFCFADGKPKHVQFGKYIASNVPSLELFCEESANKQTAATLRALSSAMLLLQRFSLKTLKYFC